MKRRFFVIEDDPVVAMDLAGILGQQYPRCDVFVGGSMAEASRQTVSDATGLHVIVNARLIDDRATQLLAELVATGGQIVMIGEPFDIGLPAIFVAMPFTTEGIVEAVETSQSKPSQTSA